MTTAVLRQPSHPAKPWITDLPCQRNSNSPIYDPRSRKSHKLAHIQSKDVLGVSLSTPVQVYWRQYLFHFLTHSAIAVLLLFRFPRWSLHTRTLIHVAEINVLCRQPSHPEESRDQHTLVCHCRTISFFIDVNRWWRRPYKSCRGSIRTVFQFANNDDFRRRRRRAWDQVGSDSPLPGCTVLECT